jgi:hypothetical protein
VQRVAARAGDGVVEVGGRPRPLMKRTPRRKSSLRTRGFVKALCGSKPLAYTLSTTPRRSCCAVPMRFWLITVHARAGSMQAGTLGTPSTSTKQEAQEPMQQYRPRGRW